MIVNREAIQAWFVGLKTIFNNAFSAAPSTWEKIAMESPSSSSEEDYSWLSTFPKMRRWIGAKVVKNLSAYRYVVVNEDFEATVAVRRNDIEDDKMGKYKPQAMSAGVSAAQWPDELVYEAVNGAFKNVCFDGQPFFDTDHPVGDGTVSNMFTKVLSNASLAAAQAGYGAARTAQKQFKDEEGRSLNINPNILLVGPALEDTARMLLTHDKLADNTPNPYKGTAELVVDGRIESDTFWCLLDTTQPVKPFVFQPRKKPVFVQQTNPDSPDVFNLAEYKFGAEARGASGYGFWQLAFGSTGEG
ncbi:head protein [Aeromonas hydrophila]|uniref:Mu-like prophage major head subunit gpT family protein n=1 Tax=Aeromonas hydrophila TaxID=644 RepID=UPI0005366122|nr:Mu-like prophage major head subunit gpT family protein [Aeromonas hydrophila]KHA57133.1 head protein [Aeromonas hydrophila]